MKTIIIAIILTVSAQLIYPQSTARERIEQRQRAESKSTVLQRNNSTTNSDLQLNEILNNSRWSRVIYRYLDLSKPANSPLKNFSTIFNLLQNNEIKAYEYIDGQELFTDEYLINLTEIKERFDIQDDEIPSNDVQGYYLKEVYYFDTPTSSFRVLPIAICPIMHRFSNYEGTTRYPLFWIPYSEIEPYTRQIPVMLSSQNNSIRGTIDDFFRTRKYDGEIYKTYTSTIGDDKEEQDKVEQELIDFENMIKEGDTASSLQIIESSRNQNRKTNIRSTGNSGSSQSMRNRRY